MTILKTHQVPGMPSAAYDEIVAGVGESLQTADGFVAHYAIADDTGITVIEIWESKDQHDAWFDPTVRPQLPPGTPEPEFQDVHNSRTA